MRHQHIVCWERDRVQMHGEMSDPAPVVTLNDPSMSLTSTTRRTTMTLAAYLLALVVGNPQIIWDHLHLEQGLERTQVVEAGARLIRPAEATFIGTRPNWTLCLHRDRSSRFGKRWLDPNKRLRWMAPILFQIQRTAMERGRA